MTGKFFLTLAALLTFTFIFNEIACAKASATAHELAISATAEDSNLAKESIASLRKMGPEGLKALLETYSADIEEFKKTGKSSEKWARIAKALDEVAMQKDVYASNLFWHTDLNKAKAEAKRTGKPILSLRLLGNLNEELSCANSRFFRATLYPNAEISKVLNENYILHWQSERPAPKITIDFGDGRKIERTITGNSIHYVLNGDGTVLDALPGLNNPQVFMEFLQNANSLSKRTDVHDAKSSPYTMFRGNKYRTLTNQMNRIGRNLKLSFDTSRRASRDFEEMPPAIAAMTVAVTKSITEMPSLKSITSDMTRYGEEQINLETWKKIAELGGRKAKLDANSVAFIRRQVSSNEMSEKEFAEMISKLEEYISVDTARNEFLLRPTLLVWLAKGEDQDMEKLNDKVYSKLFLTPKADKWLGLYAPDIYSALDGNGIK